MHHVNGLLEALPNLRNQLLKPFRRGSRGVVFQFAAQEANLLSAQLIAAAADAMGERCDPFALVFAQAA